MYGKKRSIDNVVSNNVVRICGFIDCIKSANMCMYTIDNRYQTLPELPNEGGHSPVPTKEQGKVKHQMIPELLNESSPMLSHQSCQWCRHPLT